MTLLPTYQVWWWWMGLKLLNQYIHLHTPENFQCGVGSTLDEV